MGNTEAAVGATDEGPLVGGREAAGTMVGDAEEIVEGATEGPLVGRTITEVGALVGGSEVGAFVGVVVGLYKYTPVVELRLQALG